MDDVDWQGERAALMRTAISVALAVSVYGLSFGALAVSAGFSLLQTAAMSLLMFNGASQLAFVGVLGAGGAALVAVLTALVIGSRNAVYGVRLQPLLQVGTLRRALAAHVTIDESTAIAIANDRADGRAARFGFWATAVAVYALWNLATLAGGLAAQHIGDPRALGLDTAVAAGLAGLVWPALRERSNLLVACIAGAAAVVLTPALPTGVPVIVGGVVAVASVCSARRIPRVQVSPARRALRVA